VQTLYGRFELRTYLDTARNQFHHALIKGEPGTDEPCLTRVHLPQPLRDMLAVVDAGSQSYSRWTVHAALEYIARAGRGVFVLLGTAPISSDGIEQQIVQLLDEGTRAAPTRNASIVQVGVGGQILRDIGVRKMLLMGTPVKYTAIAGFDLEVVDYVNPDH
jgi:3,4-dihydroxy 2-butanone 4-phosphate synthase/GTP cyclohydrolase II